MRKMDSLDEKVLDPNIDWDTDSTKSKWIEVYEPMYSKTKLGEIVDFSKLTYYKSGEFFRVIAPAKKEGFKDIMFGGDVIVNLDNVPFEMDEDKYSRCNLGLLPREGNLQWGKKKIGNDWKLYEFWKAVDDFYKCFPKDNAYLLTKTKNRNNKELTIRVMELLRDNETQDDRAIFGFCRLLYGIEDEEFIKMSVNEEIEGRDFIEQFWKMRESL